MLEGVPGLTVVDDSVEPGASAPGLDALLVDFDPEAFDALRNWAFQDGLALVVLGAPPELLAGLLELPIRGVALLSREADRAEIAAAIEAASQGLIVLDSSHALRVGSSPSGSGQSISPRESQVLQLISEGLANKEIAQKLEISLHTVKFHVATILEKLAASSRTEAVTIGIRDGIVHV
jgi:DNA-binding NarL/FixJ family response regulator